MKPYDPVKKQLQDYRVEVDTDKLWANTSHAIPQKRKRRGILFFFLLGAALLGGGYLLRGQFNPTSGQNSNTLATSTENSTSKSDQQEVSNTNQTPLLNKDIAENHEANVVSQPAAEHSTVSSKTTVSANHQRNSNPSTGNDAEAKLSSDSNIRETSQSASSDHVVTLPTTITTSSVQLKSERNKMEESNKSTAEENEITSASLLLSANEKTISIVGNEEDMPVTIITSAFTPRLNFISEKITTLSADKVDAQDRLLNIPAISPVRKQDSSKPFYSLVLTETFGFSNMTIKPGNAESTEAAAYRSDRIKSLEHYTTRLGGEMQLLKRLTVGAGLAYTKLVTETSFDWTATEHYTTDGVTEIIIDENGTQHFQTGEVDGTRITTYNSTRFNNHTMLNIEVSLAYTILRGYRYDLSAGIRGHYNLTYCAEGSTFGPDLEPVKFSGDDQPYALSNPFGFGLNAAFHYRLSRRVYLRMEISYDQLNYQEKNLSPDIHYRHGLYGAGLGLKYQL